MAQTFLDTGQDGVIITGLDIDHAIRRESGLSQGRGEEIGTRNAPQHLALGARADTGRKQRRSCAINRAVTAASDLVQGTKRKSLTRKARVQLSDPKRKNRLYPSALALHLLDGRAQFFSADRAGAGR